METIGDRIKSKRKESGMTQLELANQLSVTDRAVSKWEQNEGNPDISLLPRIAEIFHVSLDYLMLGNEPEKEIVIMSKIELCAKNDDPSMIDDSLSSNQDENGKTLLDYVKQYNSKKVLKALIDNCSHQTHYMKLFKANQRTTKKAIEIMLTCIPVDRERKVIREIYGTEIRSDESFKVNLADLKNVFKLLVAEYKDLSEEQRNYYFGMKENEGEGERTCWFEAYPYFVEYSITENNLELCELLLNQIEKHNAWVESSINSLRKKYGIDSEFRYHLQYFYGKKVYLLQSTLDNLLSNKNFKLAYRINSLLEKPHPRREIELLEMENSTSVSEKDKAKFRCVDCFMIIPEEIKKLKDLKHVKFILDNNYVNYYEMVYKLLKTNKKALFRFFIDNNLIKLSDLLINDNEEKLLIESWQYFNYGEDNELTKKQPIIITENPYKKSEERKIVYYQNLGDIYIKDEYTKTSENKLIEYFESFKNDIFNETKLIVEAEEKERLDKLERAKLVKGLTREYFENLLLKGNDEMFVIKLCSLFDAIIRFDYNCDADDFFGRMNQFFDKGPKKQDTSDVWAYLTYGIHYEEKYVKPWEEKRALLNKLRIKRNSIVHPEKDERAELSDKELKECLDFVFEANGGKTNQWINIK